jgi:hypothetical protein
MKSVELTTLILERFTKMQPSRDGDADGRAAKATRPDDGVR